jgi:hypothetical protein
VTPDRRDRPTWARKASVDHRGRVDRSRHRYRRPKSASRRSGRCCPPGLALFQPNHRPTGTWRSNAVGSARVFAAAADARVGTVVYASSVGAYCSGPARRHRRRRRVLYRSAGPGLRRGPAASWPAASVSGRDGTRHEPGATALRSARRRLGLLGKSHLSTSRNPVSTPRGIERSEGSENVADLVSGNRFPDIAPPR